MWTRHGHICDADGNPHVITKIQTPAGLVELCFGCTKRRWDIELEEVHAPFRNHLSDRLRKAVIREMTEQSSQETLVL